MWQTCNSYRFHHRPRKYFWILNLISSSCRIHIFSYTETVRIPVLLCNGFLLFSCSSVIPNTECASPLQNTLRNFDANRLNVSSGSLRLCLSLSYITCRYTYAPQFLKLHILQVIRHRFLFFLFILSWNRNFILLCLILKYCFIKKSINPLALELDIYSLAHHLCKMWIFYELRRAILGNTRHFVEQ
jgi:hypothetical protein